MFYKKKTREGVRQNSNLFNFRFETTLNVYIRYVHVSTERPFSNISKLSSGLGLGLALGNLGLGSGLGSELGLGLGLYSLRGSTISHKMKYLPDCVLLAACHSKRRLGVSLIREFVSLRPLL